MNKDELLKPRYKVIADYPPPKNHPYFEVGYVANTNTNEDVDYFDKYPNLFKKLEWWEDRKLEEMPEYIKCQSPDFCFKKGDIVKADKWLESFGPTLRFYPSHTNKVTLHPHLYIPATPEEYEQYINQQKQANDTE